MSGDRQGDSGGDGQVHLRRNTVGVAHIVFFVVAAAAPLTAILGSSPAAFAFGNGPGVPVVYLLVGLLYVVFSAGFTAMSPYVRGSNGFYAYVVKGIGRAPGSAVAVVALASYQAIATGAYGLFGFFAHETAARAGFDLPWWAAVLPLLLLVHVCGRRAITFTGNLLAICMVGEMLILLALCVVIGVTHPSPAAWAIPPNAVLTPGLGIAIVFVVASFIGFEATVIFGEEATDPARTIPRATYIAVILIAVFYAMCTWAVVAFYGPSHISAAATADPGNLFLRPISALLGPVARDVTQALLLTSLFACVLSFHATIARYLCAMSAVGLSPRSFGRVHVVHGSPHVAGAVQTVVTFVMLALAAAAGIDPFAGLFAWTGTFASLGILAIQIITSMAVFRFFRRNPRIATPVVGTLAPLLAVFGLSLCLVLATMNVELIAGTASRVVLVIPFGVVLVGFVGWLAGVILPSHEGIGIIAATVAAGAPLDPQAE